MNEAHEYRLPFCSLNRLSDKIVEVRIDEGIEISLAMVTELHRQLLVIMGSSFGVLVDKVHSYSMSFEAQQAVAALPEIVATAALVYNSAGEMATQQVQVMREDQEKPLAIFHDRDGAVKWLQAKVA